MHARPMVTVLVPHMGGPILPPEVPVMLVYERQMWGFFRIGRLSYEVRCLQAQLVRGAEG